MSILECTKPGAHFSFHAYFDYRQSRANDIPCVKTCISSQHTVIIRQPVEETCANEVTASAALQHAQRCAIAVNDRRIGVQNAHRVRRVGVHVDVIVVFRVLADGHLRFSNTSIEQAWLKSSAKKATCSTNSHCTSDQKENQSSSKKKRVGIRAISVATPFALYPNRDLNMQKNSIAECSELLVGINTW